VSTDLERSNSSNRAGQDAVIDQDQLLNTIEHDPALLKEIVSVFCSTYPALLAELRKAIAKAAFLEIRGTVHQMEGMMASLGATNAVAMLRKMGALARTNQLQPLPQLFQDLNMELDRAKIALESIVTQSETVA
jgi:HPt (histidine-containing phosphotransfer) domain-containing protein